MLYDSQSDTLKSFLTSSEYDEQDDYRFKLSDNAELCRLATEQSGVVIDSLQQPSALEPWHLAWLKAHHYQSCFIVPMFHVDHLIGMMFFDSSETGCFTEPVQRELLLYTQLVRMTVVSELSLVRSLLSTVKVARDFTDLRDVETGLHLDRMAHYSRLIALHLSPKYGLNDEWIEHIFMFASVHDIGKIGVPDSILCKPGRLTPEERVIMQRHVNLGVSILDRVLSDYELVNLRDTEMMRNIVAYHHEYLDGSGYPNGLAGEAIPLEARIATVADIFDALTSRRPYKTSWPVSEAIAELERMQQAGKLDPDCVTAVRENQDAFETIVDELADEQERKQHFA
jgi:HD-GYP domain-containing protein (c-di-GMP phosphodiesterase class II)